MSDETKKLKEDAKIRKWAQREYDAGRIDWQTARLYGVGPKTRGKNRRPDIEEGEVLQEREKSCAKVTGLDGRFLGDKHWDDPAWKDRVEEDALGYIEGKKPPEPPTGRIFEVWTAWDLGDQIVRYKYKFEPIMGLAGKEERFLCKYQAEQIILDILNIMDEPSAFLLDRWMHNKTQSRTIDYDGIAEEYTEIFGVFPKKPDKENEEEEMMSMQGGSLAEKMTGRDDRKVITLRDDARNILVAAHQDLQRLWKMRRAGGKAYTDRDGVPPIPGDAMPPQRIEREEAVRIWARKRTLIKRLRRPSD
jgi:hypothetical protein